MHKQIRDELQKNQWIDITTTGRKSGRPSRIEIAYQIIDGTFYISGTPGKRDWYANLVANPEFTIHLKKDVKADVPARARPITDPAERRAVLTPFTANWNRSGDLDDWLERSPLVEVSFTEE